MKYLKTLFAVVIVAAMLSCPALAISLQPGSGSDFYVLDNAHVLSADTKSTIAGYNATLEQQCDNAQLVVVTVSYLDEDSQVAATQLMNDWGVGSASSANGMLLLLVANEYRGWLAVGEGVNCAFTDDMAERYLNKYFWDYIDKDQFDKGVTTLCEKLYNWYLDSYSVQTPDYAGSRYFADQPYDGMYGAPVARRSADDLMSVVILILLIVLVIRISNTSRRYLRMRGWGYTGGFWPIFWFGGHRHYRDWHHRNRDLHRRTPPPPPGPHGPGGFGPGPGPAMRYNSRPSPGPSFSSRPRSSGGGSGRSGGFGGSSFHGGGSSFHGGGFGGHSGGGGGGRH